MRDLHDSRAVACCAWLLATLVFGAAACGDDSEPPANTAGTSAADGGAGRAGFGGAGGSVGRGAAAGTSGRGSAGVGGATAGRGDDPDDAGTDPQEPNSGPKGSVRGWIAGFRDADIAGAVVAANGVAAIPTQSGHFFVGAVPVGSAVSVFVRAPGYSTAHARIPVREREVTPLILETTKLATEVIAEPGAAHESTFGSDAAKHTLNWPAGALQSIYGTAPSGEVQFQSASLSARLTPANISARGPSNPIPLRTFAVVEVRLQQPRAALMLAKKSTLNLYAPATDGVTPALYRFDERSGLFEAQPASSYDAATQTLTAEIDRLGIFAAATPMKEVGCAAGRLVDARGASVLNAAIHFQDMLQREGGFVWTGADGRYCLPISPMQPIEFQALGISEGRIVAIDSGSLPSPPSAAACGSSACVDAGTQTANDRPVGCVRGQLPKFNRPFSAMIRAMDAAEVSVSVSSGTGDTFCLDVTRETSLEIQGTRLDCGEPRALPVPTAAISCAEQNCRELGEIKCCLEEELCNDGKDDDCDSRTDEGCNCGSHDCRDLSIRYTNLPNRCCSEDGFCGFRYPSVGAIDHCFAFTETSSYDANCPSEQLTIAGQQLAPTGCCIAESDQCGLNLAGDCLPRSEFHYLTNMSLSTIPCSSP